MPEMLEKPSLPEIDPITDEQILSCLRKSCQMAEVYAQAEKDVRVLAMCERFEIMVSDEELQVAGDVFRTENRLTGAAETMGWLAQQRMSVEDWSEGIRLKLMMEKLHEHMFGALVDSHYMNNREDYQRVALSQILVQDASEAARMMKVLERDKSAFCRLALETSKGRQSKAQGGFVGVRFLAELMPELTAVLKVAQEGDVVGPVQTQIGFHVLKVERWLPVDLSEVRQAVIEKFASVWWHGKPAE